MQLTVKTQVTVEKILDDGTTFRTQLYYDPTAYAAMADAEVQADADAAVAQYQVAVANLVAPVIDLQAVAVGLLEAQADIDDQLASLPAQVVQAAQLIVAEPIAPSLVDDQPVELSTQTVTGKP